MVNGNYEKVLDKISRASGLDREEIKRKIEAKRAKLSDLVSYEGAAQIVAAELGINFENEKLKINELLPGMRKVNVTGKIISLSPIRAFKTKSGDESKVVNLVLADDTSNIKVVLWDTNHIALLENGAIKGESIVEIKNATMRDNELHLGSFSEFKISDEFFVRIMTERVAKEKKISEFVVSDSVRTRAFILQSFEPKFFYICRECKKKAVGDGESFVCTEHGKIIPEKRAVINIVLDDGTATIRAVLFHEMLNLIGLTELENIERLIAQREGLFGKEMIFTGDVRTNKFFNEPEFIVDGVSEINLDELIADLEKR